MSERIAYQFNGDHVLKFAGMQKLTGEQVADELNRLYTIIAEKNEQIAEPERKVEPWIPVNERLPEGDGAVEFYSDDLRNPTCHVIGYYKDGKWFFAGKEFVNVTHWKPVTAAPRSRVVNKPDEVVVFSPEQSKVVDLLLDRIDRQAKLIAAQKASEADLRDLTALATRIEMDATPFGMGDLGAQCCHSLPALRRAIAALSPTKEQRE